MATNEVAATSAFSELWGILNCRQENVDYRGLHSRTKGISLPVPKLLRQGCYKVFAELQGGKHPFLSPLINKKQANNTKHKALFQRNRKQYLTKSNRKHFLLVRHHAKCSMFMNSLSTTSRRLVLLLLPFFFSLPFNREEKGL